MSCKCNDEHPDHPPIEDGYTGFESQVELIKSLILSDLIYGPSPFRNIMWSLNLTKREEVVKALSALVQDNLVVFESDGYYRLVFE